MDTREWLEMVLAGIVVTAFGSPLGDALKWILWKIIAFVWEQLILHIRAPVNAAAPEVQTRTDATVNTDDFTDFELRELQIVPMEVGQVLRLPDNLLPEA